MQPPKIPSRRATVSVADLVRAYGKSRLADLIPVEKAIEGASTVGFESHGGLSGLILFPGIDRVRGINQPEPKRAVKTETPPWKKPLQMPWQWVMRPPIFNQKAPRSEPLAPPSFNWNLSREPGDVMREQFSIDPNEVPQAIALFTKRQTQTFLYAAQSRKDHLSFERLLERCARRESLWPLPLSIHQSIASRLALLFDLRGTQGLVYGRDAQAVINGVRDSRGLHGLEVWIWNDDNPEVPRSVNQQQMEPWDSNTVVMLFSADTNRLQRKMGVDTVAIPWGEASIHDQQIEKLLQAVSVAVSIEPELVRALRLALIPDASALTELAVFDYQVIDVSGAWGSWKGAEQLVYQRELFNPASWPEHELKAVIEVYLNQHAASAQVQREEELQLLFMALGDQTFEPEIRSKVQNGVNELHGAIHQVSFWNANLPNALSLKAYSRERLNRIGNEVFKRSPQLESFASTLAEHAFSKDDFRDSKAVAVPAEHLARVIEKIERESAERSSPSLRRFVLKQYGGAITLLVDDPDIESEKFGQVLGDFVASTSWVTLKSTGEDRETIETRVIKLEPGRARVAVIARLQLEISQVDIGMEDGSVTIIRAQRDRGLLGWEGPAFKGQAQARAITLPPPFDHIKLPLRSSGDANRPVDSDEFGVFWDFELPANQAIRFRYIEPGTFFMGATDKEIEAIKDKNIREWAMQGERPRHEVNIKTGFWMAETPCTVAQWIAVVGEKDSRIRDRERAAQAQRQQNKKNTHPITEVSWEEAQKYIELLQADLPEGVKAGLPSEAQWEYACRAGTSSAYWWGDQADEKRMNVNGRYDGTTPVTQFAANPWGLYDVHGNVWEWCVDKGLRKYSDQPGTYSIEDGDEEWRVLRGGSWGILAAYARAACRSRDRRGNHWSSSGFRLVLRSLPASSQGQIASVSEGAKPEGKLAKLARAMGMKQ